MPVLDWKFNALTVYMASRLKWEAVDYDPYPTLADMQADYKATGRIKVSTLYSENSIYGFPWINQCGRAWHDYAHLQMNAEFYAQGEYAASQLQIQQMRDAVKEHTQAEWFARIIDAEVNGQVEYYLQHGAFPVNGYEFTKGYLNGNG